MRPVENSEVRVRVDDNLAPKLTCLLKTTVFLCSEKLHFKLNCLREAKWLVCQSNIFLINTVKPVKNYSVRALFVVRI